MAYSLDFRKCVVDKIEAGMTWDDAMKIFSICSDTISRWLSMSRLGGSLEDAPRGTYKVRKIDSQLLLEALERTPDATLEELAKPFGCSITSIHQRLVKLGITRKKNDAVLRAKRREKAKIH